MWVCPMYNYLSGGPRQPNQHALALQSSTWWERAAFSRRSYQKIAAETSRCVPCSVRRGTAFLLALRSTVQTARRKLAKIAG